MKKTNYLLLILFVLPIIYKILTDPNPIRANIIGILIVISFVIIFFEILDKTRSFRINSWDEIKGSKYKNAFLYALFFGLPVAILLIFIISQKTYLIEAVVFIIIPITFMFGWIGANEWDNCYKLFLEKKYSTKL